MLTDTRALTKRLIGVIALAVSALALSACGGADATPAGASGVSSDSNDRDTARLKLTECMRENGVDVPDDAGGGPGGAGLSDADREKARAAIEGPCKELREAARGNISEADRQEFRDAFAKFAQCMRDEGIDLPDITPGSGPPAGLRSLDRDDPKVQAAQEKCQSELPERPGGGRGGPGPQS